MSRPEGDFYRQLGVRISNRRHELGLTQQQLALSVGLSRTSVTNIEAGRQNVVAHTVALLAEHLSLTSDELLGVALRGEGAEATDYFPGFGHTEAEMVQRAIGSTREEAHAQESSDPQTSGRATRSGRGNTNSRSR